MSEKSKIKQYIKAYQWSNVFAMLRNNRKDPKICTEKFTGKLVAITGATSGIGYLTALKYASQGANLLCINRNSEKSEKLKHEIESQYAVQCNYITADLSKLNDIYKAANTLNELNLPIDVLIHNAGIFLTKREITEDGLEKTFVVHYLSTFIINYVLADKLRNQQQARIIMVGSEGHRFAIWGIRPDDLNFEKRNYSGLKSYGAAKVAQMLSMLVFKEKFEGSNVVINSMHPGAVKSNTGKENGKLYRWWKQNVLERHLKPAQISAEALYYLGVSTEVDAISGKFFNLTTLEEPTPPALDMDVARELWVKSIAMSGLKKTEQYDTEQI